MAQYGFGSGMMWITPQTDAAGNALANPTPLMIGVLQDGSVDISFETKTLHGQNQFPVAAGRGKGKIGGKAKFAQLFGAFLNSVVFGQTLTSGLLTAQYDTAGRTIPAATPWQLTMAPAKSGIYTRDFGVIDATGRPMTRVASTPATGQYSVTAAGVYTFSTTDAGKTVFINYEYSVPASGEPTSTTSTVMNMQMGAAPSFSCDLFVPYNGDSLKLTLHSCITSKFALSTKQDDFLVPEFDFEAFADPVGRVISYSLSE